MGWRFRKSIKILPGVRLNLGKRGLTSATVGGRWLKTNVSGRGVRHTVSAPGTGLSYQTETSGRSRARGDSGNTDAWPSAVKLLLVVLGLVLALALVLVIAAVVILGYLS